MIVLQRDLGVTITAVVEDGLALSASDYERGGMLLYRLRDGIVARVPWTARTVVVEYKAGFALPDEAPPALERACLNLLAGLWHRGAIPPREGAADHEGVGAVAGCFEHRADTLPIAADRMAALERRVRLLMVRFATRAAVPCCGAGGR